MSNSFTIDQVNQNVIKVHNLSKARDAAMDKKLDEILAILKAIQQPKSSQ